MLDGTRAAFSVRQIEAVRTLEDVEFQVFSQFGEDGIIEWLVSKLPDIPNRFVEFGVEDYAEASTRFLLKHRNWRGLVMDGSPKNIGAIRSRHDFWRHDLTAVTAFITRDNIRGLLRTHGFDNEIGLLSIDIDGNDYWIWKELDCRPWLVIIEYNATFGDTHPLAVPNDESFDRTRAHSSNLYWGANISAMTQLASLKGYTLLGSNLAGHNAFFLRDDLLDNFETRITDRHARPSLYRESRDAQGNLSFISAKDRAGELADMPILNVATGQQLLLKNVGPLYSERWRGLIG
jgi:hypothetical protein